MKYFAVTFVSALLLIGFSASAQTGTISVLNSPYNAKCNGSTDDTAAFQSAATAAANSYASTGSPVTITYAGNCVVNGSVTYASGVHWRGYGLITVQTQGTSPTFYALNANVTVEKVPQLMLVAVQGSGYKQARVPDVGVQRNLGRPATHDGKPRALRVAVPLLLSGSSGS